jgi:hypothetical protein
LLRRRRHAAAVAARAQAPSLADFLMAQTHALLAHLGGGRGSGGGGAHGGEQALKPL